jgi:hypothetical protein
LDFRTFGNRRLFGDGAGGSPQNVSGNFTTTMTTYLTLILLTLQILCNSQSDSISIYINQLDNSQFHPEGTFVGWRIKTESPAREALSRIGQPATDALIKTLLDSTKFLLAHLTLADIYNERSHHMSIAWDSINRRATLKLHLSDTLQLYGHERYRGQNLRPSYYQDSENIQDIIAFWQRRRQRED